MLASEMQEHFGISSPLGIVASPHFWEFQWGEAAGLHVIVCAGLLLISGVLCAAAGIGGGGIIVTVLMFFGRLDPYDAVPLSKFIVFTGSLISLALNLPKTIAEAASGSGKELINWAVVKAIVPMALLGTLVGVVMNHAAPGWAIVIVLSGILLFMTYTICKKGLQQYQAENVKMMEDVLAQVEKETTED